jgi:hypothetical protein
MAKRAGVVAEHIEKHGFHVVKVMGDAQYPSFAYSIGLTAAFDHPEIVIFGLNDDLDFMHEVLNQLGARIAKGERFEHGAKKRDVLPGYTCPFARFPRTAFEEHLGQAIAFFGGVDRFRAVQCIWPDPKKRLPWDPRVMPPVLAREPVFLRPDAGPRDPAWPFEEAHSRRALTTIQVVKGKEPVRFVGRFDDGDWQFVCETTQDENDLVVTTLGWLLDHDPSLARAAKVAPGGAIVRKELGGRWKAERVPQDP